MDLKDKVIKPFTPVDVEEQKDLVKVDIIGREYTFGINSLPTSIISNGQEILNSPMRVVAKRNGEKVVFDLNKIRLCSHTQENAIIVGSMQSQEFIIDTTFKVEYDGYCYIDLKLMPRGRTVEEEYAPGYVYRERNYNIEQLWLEIPLKAENSFLYHFFRNGKIYRADDSIYKMTQDEEFDNVSGQFEEDESYHLGYKGMLWLGDDERGIGFTFPSDQNIQPIDDERFFEIVKNDEERILRIRFLDSFPKVWTKQLKENPQAESSFHDIVYPICYSFGMQVTPIKPFATNALIHNALHIDCFKKIKGDYMDFFANPVMDGESEIGYDRIKRLGVTTLVLHEKWNDMQNYPVLSEFTKNQIQTIVKECHKRGIKVIPYFGYEISTLAPNFSEIQDEAIIKNDGKHMGGWWREPPQRDYVVCYNSSYADFWVENIKNLIETYHFDGVYLDSTLTIHGKCNNEKHGCGYVDVDGKRKGTYPIHAIRDVMKKLYSVIEPLGGIINCHDASTNFSAMGFSHLMWSGELFQLKVMKEGVETFPIDFLRAEFTGRNFGVPVEMLVYQNRPIWTFEQASALGMVHGTFPRPNDIGFPLEFMSEIWKITDAFPLDRSIFVPYWKNQDILANDENVKCSYYTYKDVLNKNHALLIASNLSAKTLKDVKIQASNSKITILNGTAKETANGLKFEKYTYIIASVDEV